MIRRLRPWVADLGGEPAWAILGASALLIAAHHHATPGFFRNVFAAQVHAPAIAGALPFLYWFWASVVLYLLAPIAIIRLSSSRPLADYGMRIGDARAGLRISALFLAVMLPAVAIASRTATFHAQYPLAGTAAYTLAGGAHALALFAVYELSYAAYFVGWEFLFRGWMLNALLPRFGRAGAVLIPVAPFALMHLGKPELEGFGSIIAGVALGVLALRTRSFWYGALLHAAVAVAMDLASAGPYLSRP